MLKHALMAVSLVTMVAACAEPELAPEERRATSSKILGGAPDGGDPSVVGVYATDGTTGSICTGEIIAARFVLTASHCVDARMLGFTPNRFVVIAAPDMYDAPAEAVLAVKTATEFPAYDPSVGAHDLAILELETPTGIAPLPYNRRPLLPNAEGTTVRAIGYGVTTDGDANTAGRKNVANLTISNILPTSFLAAALPSTQCHGDSGGPVLMRAQSGEMIVGIGWRTVNADGTCGQGVLDTRVDVYAPWIDALVQAAPAPELRIPVSDCIDACTTATCIQECAAAGRSCAGNGSCG